MINNNVLPFLSKLGLSETESQVYHGLLETGQTTIRELAKHINMSRITVHFNVENLIKKSLVIQTQTGARRQIIAESPEILNKLVEEKLKEVEGMKKEIGSVLETINQSIPNLIARKSPVIKYYEGEAGFKDVCQRSVTNSTKEVLFLCNVEEWRKVYTEEYGKKYYIPARMKKKLFLRKLAVQNEAAEKFRDQDGVKLRETRYLPEDFNFKPTIIICDKEVSIMLSNEPYTSIVIEDKDVADLGRSVFNHLWEISK